MADDDDGGLGGDEEFCSHGNLTDSEDCDECAAEFFALGEMLTPRDDEPQEMSSYE